MSTPKDSLDQHFVPSRPRSEAPPPEGHAVEAKEAVDSGLDSCAADVFHVLGNRRHIFGIHISGLHIRLYLYDRAGVVFTTPLHLERDARIVVSALARLQMLDAFELGVEPFFHPSPSPSLSVSGDTFRSVVGRIVQVEDQWFKITDIINSTFSPFGRGTAVYGVVLVDNPKSKKKPGTGISPPAPSQPARKSARISAKAGLLRPPADTTSHHGCLPHSYPAIAPNEALVLKISWQLRSRHSEDEFLRMAASAGVAGVVRLYGSTVAGRLSDGLRARLVKSHQYYDRELRVQILGPRCTKLKNVKDVEDFKTAFRSLVRGEHLMP